MNFSIVYLKCFINIIFVNFAKYSSFSFFKVQGNNVLVYCSYWTIEGTHINYIQHNGSSYLSVFRWFAFRQSHRQCIDSPQSPALLQSGYQHPFRYEAVSLSWWICKCIYLAIYWTDWYIYLLATEFF